MLDIGNIHICISDTALLDSYVKNCMLNTDSEQLPAIIHAFLIVDDSVPEASNT